MFRTQGRRSTCLPARHCCALVVSLFATEKRRARVSSSRRRWEKRGRVDLGQKQVEPLVAGGTDPKTVDPVGTVVLRTDELVLATWSAVLDAVWLATHQLWLDDDDDDDDGVTIAGVVDVVGRGLYSGVVVVGVVVAGLSTGTVVIGVTTSISGIVFEDCNLDSASRNLLNCFPGALAKKSCASRRDKQVYLSVGEKKNMRRLGRGGWELGRRTQEEVVETSRKGKGCRGKQQQQQRQQWKEEGGVRVKTPCPSAFSRHETRSSKPTPSLLPPEQATEAPPPRSSPHLFLSSGCRSTPSPLLCRRRLRSPKHPRRGSLLPTYLIFSSVFRTPAPRAAYNFSSLLASDSLPVLGLIQPEQATVYAINFGLETRVSVSNVMILMYRTFGAREGGGGGGSGPRPPKAYRRCGGSGDVVRAEAEHMGGRFEASCDAMFSGCCRCCCCHGPRPVSFGFIPAAQSRAAQRRAPPAISWPGRAAFVPSLRCMWKGGDWVGVEDGTRREL
ncbi:hypothetical protein BHM03_00013193 [Ensete ventricosum]|nr:hypothetical protein BHM03_00013193 [Ensete ventricosum]